MGEWSYSADVQELNGIIQRIRYKIARRDYQESHDKKTVSQLEKERDTEQVRENVERKKTFLIELAS
jgi:hypothetical protein